MTNFPTDHQLALAPDLIHAISWNLNVPTSRLFAHTHLRDDLLLDPVDVTLLIAALESRFHHYLSDDEAATIETIGDCSRCFAEYPASAA